jgi:septum formation protein
VVEENARRKALGISPGGSIPGSSAAGPDRASARGGPNSRPWRPSGAELPTLGADTVVAVDGGVLGKPADEREARAYLERLAGRAHQVVGGIALAEGGAIVASAVEVTEVRFRTLDAALLDHYVGTGEWRGRAGGYAIQGVGAVLVAGISGDYLNVVGLPLARLLDLWPGLLPPAG